MELLGDVGQVEYCFFLFGVSVSVGARQVHCLRQTQAEKSFWTHLMVPLGDVVKWELVLVCLEIVLILTQDRCTVCVEHTQAGKSFWTHPKELLGDVGHVEPHFFPYVDSVSVDARQVYCLRQTQAEKSFWTHLMVPLGDKAQVEARFDYSEIVLFLKQDRCMVCVARTIGS